MERSILEWSIRALLLAAGTGLVVSSLRVCVPSAQHRAWAATMLAMLLLPAWTQWGPSVTAPILPPVQEHSAQEPPSRSDARSIAQAPPEDGSPVSFAEPSPAVPRWLGPDWRQILFAVYLTGVIVTLSRLIRSTLQLRSFMRAVHQAEGFVTSPLCAAPVTIGWLRPLPCLPDRWRTWPAAKLEAVLVHEREHARRRDPLVQWLALLNRCIFWFHPVAWWLERKLAALAEEACDAAVLAHGHAANDYARYLIEMARSVNEMGARLRWAGAGAFSAGNLPRRIQRMMDTPAMAPMSRAKSIATAILCAVMLATFLACTLGRPSRSASGQPTMSEQDRRDSAVLLLRQEQRRQSDGSLWKAALHLTPAGAKELEADVKTHPYDPQKLLELVRYYRSKNNLEALDALTLWFVQQRPDIRVSWSSRSAWDSVWDQDGYVRGRQLWTSQLQKTWKSPFVYMNAAEFLSGNDDEQAEKILLEGRQRFPSYALHWEVLLARHYAWVLTGRSGQPPQGQIVLAPDESASPAAQGPYARKVRQMLLASRDTELVNRTVEQLQRNRPNLEFSMSLVEHVLSLQPDNIRAHIYRHTLRQFAVELRAKTDPGNLNDADRLVLLQSQLRRPDARDAATKANELLALASRNTKSPDYGTAIFLANIQLGEAALNRGDRADAVRHLLAASDAPPTEFLRYNQIDLSFVRKLVDAGERDAVAKFLDRCAKFNKAGKPLAEWAFQVRKGRNPKLSPNFNVFRKAG